MGRNLNSTTNDNNYNTQKINSELLNIEKLHDMGVKGNKEAVKSAYELSKKLYNENPNNYVIQAYVGSTTALLGRDAIDQGERIKLAVQGVKILDMAINNDPNNINIRTLRGYVCYRLPEMFFHKTSTAIEDFKYLVSRYEADNSILKQEFYWQILYDLGLAYKNIINHKECDKVWDKLLADTSEPKYHKLINRTTSNSNINLKVDINPEESSKKKNMVLNAAKLHYKASTQGGAAKIKATEVIERLYNENPENALISAYYADCMSMTGYESKDNSQMFASAIKAMKIFDDAVNLEPDCIEVRLLRAYHSLRLPESFFKRSSTAISDLEYLIEKYELDNSILSRSVYGDLLFILGKAYSQIDIPKESSVIWRKLIDLNIDPVYRDLVSKELRNHSLNIKDIIAKTGSSNKYTLENAIVLHDMAVSGNKKASKESFEIMKKLFEENPKNAIIEGYYGSTMALAARDSNDPGLIFSNSIKGITHLKRAVSKNPTNTTLRLLRGYLMYSLPECFFHLGEKALKDFKYIKLAYEKDNTIFPQEIYLQMLYDMGVCYRNCGDEKNLKKVWGKLLKQCPGFKHKDIMELEGDL